jgi:hypothetical protein
VIAWAAIKGGLALVPRWAWALLLASLALLWLCGHERGVGRDQEREAQAKAQAIAVKAVLKQRDTAEADQRAKFAAIDARSDKEKQDELLKAQRAADCYRSGKCRVHARFQCPAQHGVLPETAASAGGSNGEVQAGLLGADAGFLTGEASRGNRVVIALNACQATLDAERK